MISILLNVFFCVFGISLTAFAFIVCVTIAADAIEIKNDAPKAFKYIVGAIFSLSLLVTLIVYICSL